MPDEQTREERKKKLEERRIRRRKRLERASSAQISAVILILVMILAVALLVIPRPKESQLEKRPLATFPKFTVSGFFAGEFTHGIAQWYDDTIPYRDDLKNVNNTMKNAFGIRSENTVQIVGNVAKVNDTAEEETAAAPAETAAETAAEPAVEGAVQETSPAGENETAAAQPGEDAAPAETAAAPAAPAQEKNFEREAAEGDFSDGFLIINQDGHWRGLPLFPGGDETEYVTFLNTLRSQFDSSIRIYSMPVPLASAFYLPENFSDYSVDHRKFLNDVASQLDGGITTIDLLDVLGSHLNEPVFLRTDHHRSALGAYYACESLAAAAGLPFINLADYHEIQRPGYVGSMYGYTQNANLLNDPEVFPIYIPSTPYVTAYHNPDYTFSYQDDLFVRTDVANSYMAFHAGDAMIVHTVTGTQNGRKLMILKDSYGDPLSGLLTGTFEEIFSVDLRYCDVNLMDFIYDQGITDICLTMDVDTVAYPTADLMWLLQQNAGFGIPHDAPEDLVVPEGPGSPYYADAVNGNDPLVVE